MKRISINKPQERGNSLHYLLYNFFGVALMHWRIFKCIKNCLWCLLSNYCLIIVLIKLSGVAQFWFSCSSASEVISVSAWNFFYKFILFLMSPRYRFFGRCLHAKWMFIVKFAFPDCKVIYVSLDDEYFAWGSPINFLHIDELITRSRCMLFAFFDCFLSFNVFFNVNFSWC